MNKKLVALVHSNGPDDVIIVDHEIGHDVVVAIYDDLLRSAVDFLFLETGSNYIRLQLPEGSYRVVILG